MLYPRLYLSLIKTNLYYKFLFGGIGYNSAILAPLQLDGCKNIYIEESVLIAQRVWLAAVPLTKESTCRLLIKKGCTIGHYNHIFATKEIIIGENVLTADKVYISDNIHSYEDVGTPIKYQKVVQKNCVSIGDGSWIGENVCIIGASVGRNCVIGANSVVTHDIPDYSVAVGSPAKVIKKYDFSSQKWINL